MDVHWVLCIVVKHFAITPSFKSIWFELKIMESQFFVQFFSSNNMQILISIYLLWNYSFQVKIFSTDDFIYIQEKIRLCLPIYCVYILITSKDALTDRLFTCTVKAASLFLKRIVVSYLILRFRYEIRYLLENQF